jgi:6-pyruvoyltetrahydropterin/6-carboxytetrahydropterin synthase
MPDQLLTVAASGFEAALRVPLLSENHRSRRLHGHSFLVRARAAPPAGWAGFPGAKVDELGRRLQETVAPFDYRLLNDLLEQPTDENLARLIRKRLDLPGTEIVQLSDSPTVKADWQ